VWDWTGRRGSDYQAGVSAPLPLIAPGPSLLLTRPWDDYGLIDSGHGRKLERYGPWCIVRPEPQCWWTPTLDDAVWASANATFDPTDEDDAGRWRKGERSPPDAWMLRWGDVRFNARLTPFRHLAFFPEQAANWDWLDAEVRAFRGTRGRAPRILNLFGYTGVASLVCAAAGADVTHIDASKKAIGYARDNAGLSGLAGAPIRWICEDARRYVQREQKRGSLYDGIILDPPKYGRGPDGDVWRLFEDLAELAAACAALLSEDAAFLLLNAYAARISGLSLAHLLADNLKGRDGVIDWGELALAQEGGARGVGLSFFARWRGTAT